MWGKGENVMRFVRLVERYKKGIEKEEDKEVKNSNISMCVTLQHIQSDIDCTVYDAYGHLPAIFKQTSYTLQYTEDFNIFNNNRYTTHILETELFPCLHQDGKNNYTVTDDQTK